MYEECTRVVEYVLPFFFAKIEPIDLDLEMTERGLSNRMGQSITW